MSEWLAEYNESTGLWTLTNGGTVLFMYAPGVSEDEAVMLADTLSHYGASEESYLAE